MNKDANVNKNGDHPPVFRFKARLFQPPQAAKNGSLILINIPKEVGKKLHGMSRVEGTINGHSFRAALESNASGGYWLRVNKSMLEGARAGTGDTVELAILGPEPEPAVPADLQAALDASHKAKALWNDLTALVRRDWIRWINLAKKPETRARRITRTVEQLSSGKRRACCVNVYEFMQRCVREEK